MKRFDKKGKANQENGIRHHSSEAGSGNLLYCYFQFFREFLFHITKINQALSSRTNSIMISTSAADLIQAKKPFCMPKSASLKHHVALILFLTTTVILFSGQVGAQCVTCTANIVTNGTFNSNTASWTSSNGNFSSANIYPQCGSARHAMIKHTSGIAEFYQDITGVLEGSSLQFSFWGGVHVTSYDATFGLEFYNSATPSAGTLISQSKLQVDKTLTGTPAMQFYSTTVVVPAGTVKIRVRGSTNGDWLKVDEVCLQTTAPSNLCTPPAANSACTPPTTWNVDVVANGNVDWQTLTGLVPDNISVKVRVSGSGTVTIKNKNLSLVSAAAVVFFDGPTLVIDNGSLLMPASGSRYIQHCAALQVTGGFIQSPGSISCITGVTVDIGQEKAGPKFTTGATFTSAAFSNDGGYRYLENNCINVTSHFILKATGTGTGTNGLDVIKNCFFEIGDAGINHARTTAIGSADIEDAGNWETNNNQSIYASTIVIAKGNFVKNNKTSLFCDVNIKVNKDGNFHINSGTVAGEGLRVAVQNDFGNCGAWTVSNLIWYSALQKSTNVPNAGVEATLTAILTPYFAGTCSTPNCNNNGNNGNNQNSCTESLKIPYASGSYIINMGVTPQTDQNALKPYGMIYDLIKNYNVKIVWIINPNKVKDGVDFKYNGVNYSGGPFLIPAEYRNATVNARITYWQTQGVVGTTTISELRLCPEFVNRELKNVPRWTLDKRNGQIAVEYYKNAGIPETAYGGNNGAGWKNPSELNCCDDLFVLPHAEPSWEVHQRLYTWNLECKGGIWDGCTSGSAIENMVNPADRNVQTNFLTVKDPAYKGTSGIYANSNSLMLWTTHKDGTPPYTHRLPADPVAQYISTTDAAHTNGAEQIYVPRQTAGSLARWNPSTRIIAYDPTHPDVLNVNPDMRNAAAVIVYGRGFEDPNRGYVMHSSGHSYDKGTTSPAHIAAQRAFFNFSWLVAQDKAESINFGAGPTLVSAGENTRVDVTLGNGQDFTGYTVVWSSNCGGTFVPNAYDPYAEFVPPNANEIVPCVISLSVTDPCGRTTTDSRRIEIGCDYHIKTTVSHPTCSGSSNGVINMEITGESVYGSNDWVWARANPTGSGSGSGNSISGLSSGSYNVTVTSFTGCSATYTVNLEEPIGITTTVTPTNYSCFGQTGKVISNVSGGKVPYTYLWNEGTTTSSIENITAGQYTITVTDNSGCTATATASVTGPTNPISLGVQKTNVSCSGSTDGTATVTVTGGNAPLTYLWSDGITTQNRTGLSEGTYRVTVTDASGCTASASAVIAQPSPLSLSISPQQPTCPATTEMPLNSDGSILLSLSGGTLPYMYLWNDGSAVEDRYNLTAGTYTVTITDGGGCQIVKSITLSSVSKLPNTPTGINK